MEQECCGNVIYVGNGYATLVETVSHDIEISDLGEAKISITYECKFENALELIARIRRHPQYTFLVAKTKRISRKEGCMATVTIGFEGIVPDDSPEAKEGRKKYSIEGSTQQDPIETHPDFVEFAGNWRNRDTWKNGALFVEKKDDASDYGKFLGFRPKYEKKEGDDDFGGMSSFLNGSLVYTEEKTIAIAMSKSLDGLEKLGYIDEPPPSKVLPKLDEEDDRNYLFLTCSVQEVGDGVKVTKKWSLSGRGGWNKTIYEKK